jgi:hypothetical protein
MSKYFKVLIFTAVLLVVAMMFSSSAEVSNFEQDSDGYLIPLPLSRNGCAPAEVTGIGASARPPDGLEVTIKNFSSKVIKAVKIGWYVIDDIKAHMRMVNLPCDAPPTKDKIILSGNTQLIEVGPLHPQQTCLIGKAPLRVGPLADKMVTVDFPFISIDDLKDLTTEGTSRSFKKPYPVIMAVSEIEYEDGSRWKVEAGPPPLNVNVK